MSIAPRAQDGQRVVIPANVDTAVARLPWPGEEVTSALGTAGALDVARGPTATAANSVSIALGPAGAVASSAPGLHPAAAPVGLPS